MHVGVPTAICATAAPGTPSSPTGRTAIRVRHLVRDEQVPGHLREVPRPRPAARRRPDDREPVVRGVEHHDDVAARTATDPTRRASTSTWLRSDSPTGPAKAATEAIGAERPGVVATQAVHAPVELAGDDQVGPGTGTVAVAVTEPHHVPRSDPRCEVVHADEVDRGRGGHAELVEGVAAEVRDEHGAVGRRDRLVRVRPLLPVLDGPSTSGSTPVTIAASGTTTRSPLPCVPTTGVAAVTDAACDSAASSETAVTVPDT